MVERLRNRAWRCLRSSTHLDATQRLALLRHFLHVFSRIGDVESQLVLRYEILCLCESCGSADPEMKVDANEWTFFAEDCLAAGFPGNASKAFEKAISHIQGCQTTNLEPAYKLQSLSKDVKHRVNTDELGSASCSGTPNTSYSICEKSTTTVSRFLAGLKRKERSKLQMLHARNAQCMDSGVCCVEKLNVTASNIR